MMFLAHCSLNYAYVYSRIYAAHESANGQHTLDALSTNTGVIASTSASALSGFVGGGGAEVLWS